MTTLSTIDIDIPSRRWNRLQVSCMVAWVFALESVGTELCDAFRAVMQSGWQDRTDALTVCSHAMFATLAAYVAKTMWSNSAIFSEEALKGLRFGFGIIALAEVVLALVLIRSVYFDETSIGRESQITAGLAVAQCGVIVFALWTLWIIHYFLNGNLAEGTSFREIAALGNRNIVG